MTSKMWQAFALALAIFALATGLGQTAVEASPVLAPMELPPVDGPGL